MAQVSQIRVQIESILAQSIKNPNYNLLKRGINVNSFGHEAGDVIEGWLKGELQRNGFRVYLPNEFLSQIFQYVGKDEKKLLALKSSCWWGDWLISKRQIAQFLRGEQIDRWQQEGGDIILFYGNDLFSDKEKIILLNAKSHNIHRASRPPNIISGNRLLVFFAKTLKQPNWTRIINHMNLWFIGIGYEVANGAGIVKTCDIKDLFLLDIGKIPQVNFDAAIQLQWHVPDMIEMAQSRTTFIENLMVTFMVKWNAHVKYKTHKYEKILDIIKKALKI